MGHSRSSSKKEVHSSKSLPQKTTTTKKSNNLTLHLRELGKKQSPKLVEGKK